MIRRAALALALLAAWPALAAEPDRGPVSQDDQLRLDLAALVALEAAKAAPGDQGLRQAARQALALARAADAGNERAKALARALAGQGAN